MFAFGPVLDYALCATCSCKGRITSFREQTAGTARSLPLFNCFHPKKRAGTQRARGRAAVAVVGFCIVLPPGAEAAGAPLYEFPLNAAAVFRCAMLCHAVPLSFSSFCASEQAEPVPSPETKHAERPLPPLRLSFAALRLCGFTALASSFRGRFPRGCAKRWLCSGAKHKNETERRARGPPGCQGSKMPKLLGFTAKQGRQGQARDAHISWREARLASSCDFVVSRAFAARGRQLEEGTEGTSPSASPSHFTSRLSIHKAFNH